MRVSSQRAVDAVVEVGVGQVAGREVDRQAKRLESVVLPGPKLAAGLPQDPAVDGDDQVALLGHAG